MNLMALCKTVVTCCRVRKGTRIFQRHRGIYLFWYLIYTVALAYNHTYTDNLKYRFSFWAGGFSILGGWKNNSFLGFWDSTTFIKVSLLSSGLFLQKVETFPSANWLNRSLCLVLLVESSDIHISQLILPHHQIFLESWNQMPWLESSIWIT